MFLDAGLDDRSPLVKFKDPTVLYDVERRIPLHDKAAEFKVPLKLVNGSKGGPKNSEP